MTRIEDNGDGSNREKAGAGLMEYHTHTLDASRDTVEHMMNWNMHMIGPGNLLKVVIN